MADGGCNTVFTKGLSPFVVDSIDYGMDILHKQVVQLLKLKYNNGSKDVSFSQASCDVQEYPFSFPFTYLFHYGCKQIINLQRKGDRNLCKDEIPLENLIKVLHENKDVAKNLLKLADSKQGTTYVVQLAHHLLVPLSQKKVYKIDCHSNNQQTECACCNEKISGYFDDTSMGNKNVWHGCTDILIGKSNVISVKVNPTNDDDDDDDGCDIKTHESSFKIREDSSENLVAHRNHLIAETIVFGFLQGKEKSQNYLIPTIEITKSYVKFFFYDAKNDFLLESSKMWLFRDNFKGLNPSTVISLWLAINYPVTGSGLTEAIVGTEYTSDFLKNFEQDVKDIYKHELRFGNCLKRQADFENKDDFNTAFCHSGYSKPYEGKCEGVLTEEDIQYVKERAISVRKRLKLTSV